MAHVAADARLAAFAVAQHGAFSRTQALAAGVSARHIDRRLRDGSWVRQFPRVYRHAMAPCTRLFTLWSAVLWAGTGSALSHTTAAALWRFLDVARVEPELVVPRGRAPQTQGLVVHRVRGLADRDVLRVGGLPVTAPARTIIDLASVLPDDELAQALERARARGLVRGAAIVSRLDALGTPGRAGTARLRRMLAGGEDRFSPNGDGSGPTCRSARLWR